MIMTADEITTEILKSKKYSGIEKNVIERISSETIQKYTGKKDVVKAVKKELHIIHESFLSESCLTKAESLIDNYKGENVNTDRDFAVQLMALHASTRERLPEADEIYALLGEYIRAEDCVIDIGCGFNPFALPFYSVFPKKYYAFDICLNAKRLLEKYFMLINRSCETDYSAEIFDAAAQMPLVFSQGQTALSAGTGENGKNTLFMFKLMPLLERQKKGHGFRIMENPSFKKIIVSFPTKSAGGREKGMEAFYSSFFESKLPTELVIAEKAVFKNEMFYIVTRGGL